ncbi:hypothetical protein VTO42DRAFT_2926 [Malbranchea cinnamomea]
MSVTLHTTHGDLKVEIFCEAVPKTAENFLALCASGAYDNTPFHRLIPSFMIQGGDISLQLPSHNSELESSSLISQAKLPFEVPKGGASIYHPEPLEQEIHLPTLRHNARGILSMASKTVKGTAGNKTVNGSQFFITFASAPHLDGQSTVFGKVLGLGAVGGEEMDTLTKLEKANVKIDKKGRVVQPTAEGDEGERIGILSVTIHANPFAR